MIANNIDNLTKEKLAETIFSYAGACHIDNINEEIENNSINNIIISNHKEFDKILYKLAKTYRRRINYLNNTNKASRIAAVIIISIIILSTILISSVDAIRMKFFNLFMESKEEYSKITIKKSDLTEDGNIDILENSDDLNNWYIPSYVPNDFNVEKIIKQNKLIIIIFKDSENNSFVFEQNSDLNREYMLDTENALIEKISVQGQEAIIITKEKIITAIWDNDEIVFNVSGQVSREDILKFCENIYLKK